MVYADVFFSLSQADCASGKFCVYSLVTPVRVNISSKRMLWYVDRVARNKALQCTGLNGVRRLPFIQCSRSHGVEVKSGPISTALAYGSDTTPNWQHRWRAGSDWVWPRGRG